MPLSYIRKIESAKAEFKKGLSAEDAENFEACPDPKKPRFLLEHGNFTESEIAGALSRATGIETAEELDVPENAEALLPLRIINEYRCVPLADGSAAFAWPPSPDAKKWICAMSGRIPAVKIAPYSAVEGKISESFGVGAESLEGRDADDFSDISEGEAQEDENAAIIKFVNEIITRALADRATDIHIEPRRESLAIRYRIDGDMTPVSVPENLVKFKDAVVSRIKIMARLNISEKRRPQDGRIAFTSKGGEEIDIRVSSLPTLYGESVSLRLLNQKSRPVTIEDLGFLPDDAEKIARPLSLPHGIILVTGPTGSGKSTTLTAFIRRLLELSRSAFRLRLCLRKPRSRKFLHLCQLFFLGFAFGKGGYVFLQHRGFALNRRGRRLYRGHNVHIERGGKADCGLYYTLHLLGTDAHRRRHSLHRKHLLVPVGRDFLHLRGKSGHYRQHLRNASALRPYRRRKLQRGHLLLPESLDRTPYCRGNLLYLVYGKIRYLCAELHENALCGRFEPVQIFFGFLGFLAYLFYAVRRLACYFRQGRQYFGKLFPRFGKFLRRRAHSIERQPVKLGDFRIYGLQLREHLLEFRYLRLRFYRNIVGFFLGHIRPIFVDFMNF